jgi:hypothetical protein
MFLLEHKRESWHKFRLIDDMRLRNKTYELRRLREWCVIKVLKIITEYIAKFHCRYAILKFGDFF